MHNRKIRQLFNYKPTVFRNTELIYNNELANYVEKMGYKGNNCRRRRSYTRMEKPEFRVQAC